MGSRFFWFYSLIFLILFFDQTSKIIIQSALRSAIKMNEHFFNHKKIVSNYLKASEEKLNQIEKTLN